MSDVVIRAEHLTKDYDLGRGVFDLNFEIRKGEMIGLVGTNGAGKTTTIRQIMGFVKPSSGSVTINGLECYANADIISKQIGYVPGEIAFPDLRTGISFLKMQAELHGLKDLSYANELISRLALDPRANLKRMSKGMKQKTALVAALMTDPDIIIMDEPTTGLDPLMREQFIEIIKEQHKRGKTILMSTHVYEEVEDTCDRVILLDFGKIIDIAELKKVANPEIQEFEIAFESPEERERFLKGKIEYPCKEEGKRKIRIQIPRAETPGFMKRLADFKLAYIDEVHDTLAKYFGRKFKEGGR